MTTGDDETAGPDPADETTSTEPAATGNATPVTGRQFELPSTFGDLRRKLYLRLLLIGIGQSVCVVVFALLLQVLIDHAQHQGRAKIRYAVLYQPVAWMSTTGLLIALAVTSSVTVLFKALAPRMAERLAQNYVHNVRVRLFAHAAGSTTMTAQRRGIGVTVLRFTGDSTALRGWAGTGVATLAVDGVFVACTMAVLTVMLPAAGIAAGAVLIVCVLIALLLGRRLRRRVREARKQTGRLASFVNERVTHAAVIQSLGRVGKERWALSQRSRKFSEAMIRQAGMIGTLSATAEAARIGILVAVIGAAVLVGARADLLTSLVSIAGFLTTPLAALAQAQEAWQKSRIARKRINEVIGTPARLAGGAKTPQLPEGPGQLKLSRVRLTGILDNANARVPAGARVVVDGPPGGGKSVLLTAIARLHALDGGAILLDGAPIARRGPASVGRAIRLVSPDLSLLRGTVAANIGHGEIPERELDESTRLRLTAVRGLCDRLAATIAEQLPDGLRTRVGEGGHGLSRVMRFHVSLARAVCGAPRVLLLDWAGADSAECRYLLDDLFDCYPGTVICVTREAQLQRRADQRWYLDTTLTVTEPTTPDHTDQPSAAHSATTS